jgi:hypothetical protein
MLGDASRILAVCVMSTIPEIWPVFDHERAPELQHWILEQVPRNHGCRQREWKPGKK